MKILVIDSGGRGNISLWKFSHSPRVSKLYIATGNAGSVQYAERVPLKGIEELLGFVQDNGIDLTYVGPEAPLSAGIVDRFQAEGLHIIGPTRDGARLEFSKCWAKDVMDSLNIPVPEYRNFCDRVRAKEYVKSVGYPVVVKADGLAAGKGSLVCDDEEQAIEAINQIMVEKVFGDDAGFWVDIEKRIYGREISFYCITDGQTVLPYEGAQDYKRARDGDEGKNSGGMGSYSPHPWLTEERKLRIMKEVSIPLVNGLREKYGIIYKGILYFQLIMDNDNNIYVLEINIRDGDPEAQVIQTRLKTDIVDICEAIVNEKLNEIELEWDPSYWLCLVAVSGPAKKKGKGRYPGYPDRYTKGQIISGIDKVNTCYPGIQVNNTGNPDCLIVHAGTEFTGTENPGEIKVVGGRVLSVVHRGSTLEEARNKAYGEMKKIEFDWKYCRSDIGLE